MVSQEMVHLKHIVGWEVDTSTPDIKHGSFGKGCVLFSMKMSRLFAKKEDHSSTSMGL